MLKPSSRNGFRTSTAYVCLRCRLKQSTINWVQRRTNGGLVHGVSDIAAEQIPIISRSRDHAWLHFKQNVPEPPVKPPTKLPSKPKSGVEESKIVSRSNNVRTGSLGLKHEINRNQKASSEDVKAAPLDRSVTQKLKRQKLKRRRKREEKRREKKKSVVKTASENDSAEKILKVDDTTRIRKKKVKISAPAKIQNTRKAGTTKSAKKVVVPKKKVGTGAPIKFQSTPKPGITRSSKRTVVAKKSGKRKTTAVSARVRSGKTIVAPGKPETVQARSKEDTAALGASNATKALRKVEQSERALRRILGISKPKLVRKVNSEKLQEDPTNPISVCAESQQTTEAPRSFSAIQAQRMPSRSKSALGRVRKFTKISSKVNATLRKDTDASRLSRRIRARQIRRYKSALRIRKHSRLKIRNVRSTLKEGTEPPTILRGTRARQLIRLYEGASSFLTSKISNLTLPINNVGATLKEGMEVSEPLSPREAQEMAESAESAPSSELQKQDGPVANISATPLGRRLRLKTIRDVSVQQQVMAGEHKTVTTSELRLEAINTEQPPVPSLAYGLERVLFNPGVHYLQDPRSRVYNFDPYLEKLMPVAQFDFNTIRQFSSPSQDPVLTRVALESSKKYIGSTSSMTGVLKHFHFLLSRFRPLNLNFLSKAFPVVLTSFTKLTRAPDAVFLKYRKDSNTYAIDADKEFDTANILSMMGKFMEKLVTMDKEAFQRHQVGLSRQLIEEDALPHDSFHYSTMGDFVIRSQLDAHDPRVPGTGMFDLKTRAVVPIRMDSSNYTWGMDYEIKNLQGEWESFEREYYDMMRSTMLKYSLQVRLGRMDGIFVVYHNIARIFGFQYISIEELDRALHGQTDPSLGDCELLASLDMLNKIFDQAVQKFPKQSLRFHFETREASDVFMYVFAEPVTDEEVSEIQDSAKQRIKDWEAQTLGLHDNKHPSSSDGSVSQSANVSPSEFTTEGQQAPLQHAQRPSALDPNDLESTSGVYGTEDDITSEVLDNDAELNKTHSGADAAVSIAAKPHTLDEVSSGSAGISNAQISSEDTSKATVNESSQEEDQTDGMSVEQSIPEVISATSSQQQTAENTTTEELPTNVEPNTTIPTGMEDATSSGNSEDNEDASDKCADESFLSTLSSPSESDEDTHKPLLALTVTMRSTVDSKHVLRPNDLKSPSGMPGSEGSKWEVQYTLSEIDKGGRAWMLYNACKERRRRAYEESRGGDADVEPKIDYYRLMLKNIAAKGKVWRQEVDKRYAEAPTVVYEQKR